MSKQQSKKQFALLGLGKMGMGMAKNAHDHGYNVIGWNRSEDARNEAAEHGIEVAETVEEVISKLSAPRVVWLMLPAGKVTEMYFEQLLGLLEPGDIVINGGNENYKNTIKHGEMFGAKGINFMDAGVSGGQDGARNGACMMIGGEPEVFEQVEEIFQDLTAKDAYGFFPGIGAGHYVKMVHNGIEYGMMQAIAEGMDVLKKSDYSLDLKEVLRVYNNQSIVESRLTQWMADGYDEYGVDLESISGTAGSGGAAGMSQSEAKWTIDEAKEQGTAIKVIEESVNARLHSQESPNYQAKVINTLRNMFGGHAAKK